MRDRKATLKDIAAEVEVSLSIVHKVLYNKPDISERMRKRILAIADGIGYKISYVASSLRRKSLKVAFVVPLPSSGTNRYYYRDIWKDMCVFQVEAVELNIGILDSGFLGLPGNLPKHLEEVYQDHCDEISDLVTLAVEDPALTHFIDQFSKRSVPAVFIVPDLPRAKCFCCVRAQDLTTGSLVVESILGFTANKGEALVVSGDIIVSTHYMNATGLEQYFAKVQNRMDITETYNRRDPKHLYYRLVELLRPGPEISAVYSCAAINTPPVCKAVLDADRAGTIKMIGSDLFQGNRGMLFSGVPQATIYKKPFRLGYLGCWTLFNFLVRNESPRNDSIFIEPIIVLKSNLPFYGRDTTTDNAYETI